MKYIENKFKDLIKDKDIEIGCFNTCFLEKAQVKYIFDLMKDQIFLKIVNNSGLAF